MVLAEMCLTCLWLPVLLSAGAVFVASAILWMATPFHKKDYQPLPKGGDEVEAWLKRNNPPTGRFMVGWCQPDPKAPQPVKGPNDPHGILLVKHGPITMGRSLGAWFLNVVVISFVVGYVAAAALPATAEFMKVFQVVGATALLAYGGNAATKCIWEGAPWAGIVGSLVDALVYALATGAIFGAFWS
jgi:hypothetical protein